MPWRISPILTTALNRLLTAPERQTAEQLARPGEVLHTKRRLYRAFLPALRRVPAALPARLPRSALARTLRARRDGILAAERSP